MFIDVIVLVLVIIAAYKGLSKGLIVGAFSFIAFIVGLAAAIKLSAIVAGYIGSAINISGRVLPMLAFFTVFFIVILIIKFGARVIEKLLQFSMLGWANRLGGVVFYILIYLFIFSIVLFYSVQLQVMKHETVQASVTYPYLQPIAPKIINAVGTVVPLFKNMFAELLRFFQNVATKSKQQYTLLQDFDFASALG